MIKEAREYLDCRRIARREPLYSANRFARFMSDIPASEVTTSHLESFRAMLLEQGFSARTIEGNIADVVTVCKATTGVMMQKGNMITVPPPDPRPVPITSIDLIWPHCSAPLRAWIGLSYWTALRLSDAMRWLLDHKTSVPAIIEVRANKTNKRHQFPLPEWLRDLLDRGPYRFRTVSHYSRKAIRLELSAACDHAGILPVTPKQFRSRGVTEWFRAGEGAGKIIHGVSIGILSHYIDQLSILESAAPRVRLPTCFGCSGPTHESLLLDNFRKMDPAAQQIITQTAERLSAG